MSSKIDIIYVKSPFLFPFHGVVIMTVLGKGVKFHSALSFISESVSVRSFCTASGICRNICIIAVRACNTHPELLSSFPMLFYTMSP